MHLTFGPPIYLRPVCILHPHGFYGGPAGYERTDDPSCGPLIIETKHTGATNEAHDSSGIRLSGAP